MALKPRFQYLLLGCALAAVISYFLWDRGGTIERLAAQNPNVHSKAFREFIAMNSQSKDQILASLDQELKSPETEVRYKAARAVWLLGPEARSSTGNLIRLLEDPNLNVRVASLWALHFIGPAEPEAVRALEKLKDQGNADPFLRKEAQRALESLEKLSQEP